MEKITITALENHINMWFGDKWENQSPEQILAMTITLLAKVGTEVVAE